MIRQTNALLRDQGLLIPHSALVDGSDLGGLSQQFRAILKPIRGRGSAGVVKVETIVELRELLTDATRLAEFGPKMIVEEYGVLHRGYVPTLIGACELIALSLSGPCALLSGYIGDSKGFNIV